MTDATEARTARKVLLGANGTQVALTTAGAPRRLPKQRNKQMADEKADKPKEAKAKKAQGSAGKDEVKKAGFEATIEEGLETKPARLKLRYRKEVVPALMKEFGFKNPNQVPRLEKIVVNMGLGEALANNKILESAVDQLGAITGQKPVVTRARKSIANFKLREGQAIGAMVTLRRDRMYEFLDRLINVALPRVRDFKGVSQQGVRRQGQLHARRPRADHLPGDQLRPDREGEGAEHHLRHHGQKRRARAGAAAPLRHALPPVA